jgi:hypothetical protein
MLQINPTNALFHNQFRQTVKWAASHISPTNLPDRTPYRTTGSINRRYAAGVIVCRLVRALKRPATIICRYAAKPVAQSRGPIDGLPIHCQSIGMNAVDLTAQP